MLSLRDVGRVYDDPSGEKICALDQANLEVVSGELVAVMGPSGSGKSTLLQLAGGLDTPTYGQVAIDGIDLANMRERERSRFRLTSIGFVFQAFHLVPSMTVLENVALSGIVRDEPRKEWRPRAMGLLKQFGLDQTALRYPHELSGGQKQRVAVARAVYSKPKILLADEPTGNLDASSRDVVLGLIRDRVSSSTGSAGVLVTHDVLAASYADRVVFVHDGHLVSELQLERKDVRQDGGDHGRVDRILAWMATASV